MKPILSSFTSGYKITYLFLLLLIGIGIAGVITNLILTIPWIENIGGVAGIYVGMIMQSVLAMALPAYLIVALTAPHPVSFFKVTDKTQVGEKLLLGVAAFLFSYVLASFLSQWNKEMVLPPSLAEVEQMFRSMEDTALATTELVLSSKSIGRFILNLIVMAGLAALSEELFFRGALQQFIQERISNKHVAVWITALVFSIVHFQFYGFLPRLMLGAILGYLFLYTQNLWVPILFHFINNAFIVVFHYFYGDSEVMRRMVEMPASGWFALAAAGSALCTILLFKIYLWRNPEMKR